MSFLIVSAGSLMILVVAHGITFLICRRLGRYNVVGVTWGLGFVAVAAVCAAAGIGDLFRRMLLLVLVAVWGLRLAWHMVVKSAGHGEAALMTYLLVHVTGARLTERQMACRLGFDEYRSRTSFFIPKLPKLRLT